jgi:hypothetical protein
MKNYSILDKDINKYQRGKNKNEDIFLLGYIKGCCSDWRTGESHATQVKLKEKTGMPVRTIQSSISRLRETNLLIVKTRQIGQKKFNVYHFNLHPANFLKVNNSFYYTDLDRKEKGFILLLKSLCINNSNTTLYNRTKIAKELGQDRAKVSKMINDLITKNMLLELKEGFQLPANYFPLYSKDERSDLAYENFNSKDEFVLDAILNLCKSKNSILFTPDLYPLKLIFNNYPFTDEDFKRVDQETKDNYYLPNILEMRCKTLPSKIDSLNYFLKTLNIEYVEKKKDSCELVVKL